MTAVGVCGFGRCGSTMTMAVLDAGGVAAVEGSSERGHEIPFTAITALTVEQVEGRAVKLLDRALLYGPTLPEVEWRFVWMDRDPKHQAKSMVKLLRVAGVRDVLPSQLRASYRRDRPTALRWLERGGRLHVDSYDDAVRDPEAFARRLRAFLPADWPFDAVAAAAAVHHRRPYCAPDLTFEVTGVPFTEPRGTTR